ncbi:uncharacterized protein LOC110632753 [Hevea brasiliensis]|uniref:uncharacterized protein LOC110632753 n=1 Tax=Hevea brasiliensis TaxID=3981 RepID=UPI0025EF397E|nr:uncharacterized protein LOC110632753 [Hevea brasiliensis]
MRLEDSPRKDDYMKTRKDQIGKNYFSVLSLLLLSNSSCLSFFHSFNFYFSTVPVQLFSHTINKNCMFLLCNGLLVFVAAFSGLISSSSEYKNRSSINESANNYEDDALPLVLDQYSTESLLENEDKMAQEKVAGEERRENDEYITGEVGDLETQQFIVDDDQPEESRESRVLITTVKENSEVFVEEDDDYQREVVKEFDDKFPVQEEEENGMLSTEELNKKFEEFIRKTKEEIRIEAQQQLVMVN